MFNFYVQLSWGVLLVDSVIDSWTELSDAVTSSSSSSSSCDSCRGEAVTKLPTPEIFIPPLDSPSGRGLTRDVTRCLYRLQLWRRVRAAVQRNKAKAERGSRWWRALPDSPGLSHTRSLTHARTHTLGPNKEKAHARRAQHPHEPHPPSRTRKKKIKQK